MFLARLLQLLISGPAHPFIILRTFVSRGLQYTPADLSDDHPNILCSYSWNLLYHLLPQLGETCPSNIMIMKTYLSGLSSCKSSTRKPFRIHPFTSWTRCLCLPTLPQCTVVTFLSKTDHTVLELQVTTLSLH